MSAGVSSTTLNINGADSNSKYLLEETIPTRQSALLPSSPHCSTDLGGAGIIQKWGKWDQVINADCKPAGDLARAGTTDWTSVGITGYTKGHQLFSETQWDQYTCNVLDRILAWSLPLSESVVGIWALHIPTQQVCDLICLEIWWCVIRREQLLVGERDSVDSNTQNLVRGVTDSPLEAERTVGRLCLEKDRAGVLTGIWLPSLSCQFPPLHWRLNEDFTMTPRPHSVLQQLTVPSALPMNLSYLYSTLQPWSFFFLLN